MKCLLIGEYRQGEMLSSVYELFGFAAGIGAEAALFLVGSEAAVPAADIGVYLADAERYGEYQPQVHQRLIAAAVERYQPDLIVFSHSSYGWDMAPRVAYRLGAAQVSEVVDFVDGEPVAPVCNGKLRRRIALKTARTVLTLQAGAFSAATLPAGSPNIEAVEADEQPRIIFEGYEQAPAADVDLSKAEVIVSAGRGIGKPDNVAMIAELAKKLGGEYGASRPVVDAEWVAHERQVGTTGQTVSPKLYVACGISGAIQHLAGMKKSEFVVAVNTDKDAPIGEVADVLVVADVTQFIPVLSEKLG
ncbi:MAG: electron transfer flavoprotein subunit alpha/FixB family protein [Desulfofustis sp. PB-SRB1]|jgi:electron transfer flavoprotein alpha subunit|nr:electron transfer flavoprotein subunit alpha/FixB family protein [Desulfofustis sp. PB-SRB1]MBM1001543.1 electron transfer flavoprotein subunit alpha/FixB family protein [Desulfofustis sp. PB-SRB1]HBH27353.1 electron transfer flavoprotein subunit alpha/FixB family protein [Desulfofustis sp.]